MRKDYRTAKHAKVAKRAFLKFFLYTDLTDKTGIIAS